MTAGDGEAAPEAPFALLDFPESAGRTLLFRAPRRLLVADRLEEVPRVIADAERAAADGLHAVGFVAYEAAPAFDDALAVRGRTPLPLAWFGIFGDPEPLVAPPCAGEPDAGEWVADTSPDEHAAAVEAVREAIGRGDVYQVNYALRLRAAGANALGLWHRMRRAQRSGHFAYLDLGAHCIASASPELFFRRSGERIVTRPMKGTAPRGRWREEDEARAAALAASPKERAENVMIVDLLRNDLGRIARAGSVRATRLFEVERYPTVLQLTSTIEAELSPGVGLAEIFGALFPCGSVTGAPKVAATRAIAALERSPRGAYCGAIGHVSPSGEATFNVAIRTAWLDRGRGALEYGSGGGITWDSAPGAEHAEVAAKTAILTEDAPEFSLLETMRLEGGRYARRERHLARLAASAAWFGFPFDPAPIDAALDVLAASSFGRRHRVRVLLAPDGAPRVESAPLDDAELAPPDGAPRPVALASSPVRSTDRFLFHKTTHRATYDRHRRAHPDAFDVLLYNERDELTEFTIGNLVLQLDGARCTPPRECGLLAGVFRAELLERGEVSERVLTRADLERAEALWLVNSLREWVRVAL